MQKSDITQKLVAAKETVAEAIAAIADASSDYDTLMQQIAEMGLSENEMIPGCKQTAESIEEQLHDVKDMIDNLNTATEAI